jgi:hypothetical protein
MKPAFDFSPWLKALQGACEDRDKQRRELARKKLAELETIKVKSNVPAVRDSFGDEVEQCALWDRDPKHPGGEIYIADKLLQVTSDGREHYLGTGKKHPFARPEPADRLIRHPVTNEWVYRRQLSQDELEMLGEI